MRRNMRLRARRIEALRARRGDSYRTREVAERLFDVANGGCEKLCSLVAKECFRIELRKQCAGDVTV